MIPYWVLFAFPALAALIERPAARSRRQLSAAGFSLVMVLIGLMIGMRYQVGGDWFTYNNYLLDAELLSFGDILGGADPGYLLVNWLVSRWGGDLWQVNLICGSIFAAGLFIFCLNQPRRWLALTVSVPVLIVLVAMGYTRQGVAIGLAMIGLAAFISRRSNWQFVFWVALAATFHKSAVLLIPIAALTSNRGRWWNAAWVLIAAVVGYVALLQDSVSSLMAGYIEARYQSAAAAVRVSMSAAPAALFLLFRNSFIMMPHEKRLWVIIAMCALAMVVALVLSPSSAVVDRLALYTIPLQLAVLSRLPETFGRGRRILIFAVIVYTGMIHGVWLNFAINAPDWLPYRLYPIFG